jgi:hypothetical protein
MTTKKKPAAKSKRPIGKPTKYRPEYPEKLLEYFESHPLYMEFEEERMSASGAIKTVRVREAGDLPTFEGFALEIGVIHETLIEWSKKHPDFSEAYTACKGIQKKFIQTHGTKGRYNANFTKFFAINCLGMRDSSHVETDNNHKVEGYGLAFDLSKKPEEL